jgi:uncharacterized protein YdbL (DUF1318 family)
MRQVLYLKLLALGLLAACVTVNVYFPAAEAEQAADRIIDSVTSQPASQPQESKPQQSKPQPSKLQSEPTKAPRSSSRAAPTGAHEEQSVLLAAAGRVLELLVPAASAQANANIDISTPEIRAVTASMQQRFGELQTYFASGVIGLTADGLVDVRDQNAVPLAERATVKRLVAEDNRDRATLYAEIARANGHPEWESDIRRIFARRWVERGAQPGWYYQDSSGKWVQK